MKKRDSIPLAYFCIIDVTTKIEIKYDNENKKACLFVYRY